jgi:DNA-binding protein
MVNTSRMQKLTDDSFRLGFLIKAFGSVISYALSRYSVVRNRFNNSNKTSGKMISVPECASLSE